jgi:hypothetical protein
LLGLSGRRQQQQTQQGTALSPIVTAEFPKTTPGFHHHFL